MNFMKSEKRLNKEKATKELLELQKNLIEKAKIIIEGKDFEVFNKEFKNYKEEMIDFMIKHQPQNINEDQVFLRTCLVKIQIFKEIFDPIKQLTNKK